MKVVASTLLALPMSALWLLAIPGCGDDAANCIPMAELCNGYDDDCDGMADEDLEGRVLSKACTTLDGQPGTALCQAGDWSACVPACTPTMELCDGVDNDCNGVADDAPGGGGLTQPCNNGGQAGTQLCAGGQWGDCIVNCTPSTEVCDGADNDCDGETDEDDLGSPLTRDCSNHCGPGTEVCVSGQYLNCTAPNPSAETCNGVDDDCDGDIDEDFQCAMGASQPCGSDVGACEYGTQLCDNRCEWGTCLGGTTSVTEQCEGAVDEDCDGTVDNGCSCTNGTTQDCCGGTTLTCTGGSWNPATCPTPPTETCNGVDDDCNGIEDDNLPANPYLLGEDVTGVDDCAHEEILPTIIGENEPAESFTFRLYKQDRSNDVDYFSFETLEIEDTLLCISCAFDGTYCNECYEMSISLTEPSGADYEFCLIVLGAADSGNTCSSPLTTVCSTDQAPNNQLDYRWQGGCAIDDNYRFYLQVFSASGTEQSCEPYDFSLELWGSGPQDPQCSL